MDAFSLVKGFAEISPGKLVEAGTDCVDVDLEVIFGPGELPVGSKTMRIRVRRATVALVAKGADVVNGTRYAIKLQKFKIKETERAKQDSRNSHGARGAAEIDASLLNWVPKLALRLKGGGEIESEKHDSRSSDTAIQSEVVLIEPIADSKWMLGSEVGGDVRKSGGFLFGSYFQESRDIGANKYAPLCRLRITDKQKFRCYLHLNAKTYDFDFSFVGKWGENEGVKDSEKERFAEDMRSRIAGIVAQKGISQRLKSMVTLSNGCPNPIEILLHGGVIPEDEIVLAIGTADSSDIQKVLHE